MPFAFATRLRAWATSIVWVTPPARPSTSLDATVWTESMTTRAMSGLCA
jgi:hypothetical protein